MSDMTQDLVSKIHKALYEHGGLIVQPQAAAVIAAVVEAHERKARDREWEQAWRNWVEHLPWSDDESSVPCVPDVVEEIGNQHLARQREECAKVIDAELAEWVAYSARAASRQERDHGAYMEAMAKRFLEKIRNLGVKRTIS